MSVDNYEEKKNSRHNSEDRKKEKQTQDEDVVDLEAS